MKFEGLSSLSACFDYVTGLFSLVQNFPSFSTESPPFCCPPHFSRLHSSFHGRHNDIRSYGIEHFPKTAQQHRLISLIENVRRMGTRKRW
jgi:hypothetical protein